MRHLPLARLPVPARGRLRAAAILREDRHLPAQAVRPPNPARSQAEPAGDLCRACSGAGSPGMSAPADQDFFIGYLNRMPARLCWILGATAVVLVVGFAALGLALGVAVDDPGDGDYAWNLGTRHLA